MNDLSNERKAELLGFLRDHAHNHHLARENAAVKSFYNEVIDAAERSLRPPPVQFQWTGAKIFHIDGIELHAKGRGLSLAFIRFAGTQTGVAVPHLGHVYSGKAEPRRCAIQALRRAADDVERVSPRLAAAIRSIGTADGNLVLSKPPNVACSSPFLVDLVRRAEALGITS